MRFLLCLVVVFLMSLASAASDAPIQKTAPPTLAVQQPKGLQCVGCNQVAAAATPRSRMVSKQRVRLFDRFRGRRGGCN